jgi:hypothetical protein
MSSTCTTQCGDDDDGHDVVTSPANIHATTASSSPIPSPTFEVVPLNHDDEESCDDIRALAKALAPSLLATEEILQVPMEFQNSRKDNLESDKNDTNDDNDDDDLEDEMDALRSSAALLRQELDMAQDFSSLFQFTAIVVDDGDEKMLYHNRNHMTTTPNAVVTCTGLHTSNEISPPSPHVDPTNQREVDESDSVNDVLTPIKIPDAKQNASSSDTVETYSLDNGTHSNTFVLVQPSPSLSLRRHRLNTLSYTVKDHRHVLAIRKEQHGWYSVAIGQHLGISSIGLPKGTSDDETDDNIKYAVTEYCLSIPVPTLHQLFVGIPDRTISSSLSSLENDTDKSKKSTHDETSTEAIAISPALPVRTITMRIRPDVLCGAVMEVVHSALNALQIQVTKHQGGHIQGVIGHGKIHDETNEFVPFMIDVRLVTTKTETCDRVLLLRIYHNHSNSNSNEIAPGNDSSEFRPPDDHAPLTVDQTDEPLSQYVEPEEDILCERNVSQTIASHLREAAALIQIMESTKGMKRIYHVTPTAHLTQDDMRNIVTEHLLTSYRACPSVKSGVITLPSLNAEDFAVIVSSGRLLQLIWDEIETRDFAYTTLRSSRFGSFPSLPTLDVHYCAQLRRLSRDAMTTQLLKSASELEQYAREAELACANMISLLKPTFMVYGIEAPQLPKPKQLTEYPFDFVPPQTSCPPWGVKVQHALNEIQAWTGDANRDDTPNCQIFPVNQSVQYADKSIELAKAAVRLIFEAFQKQHDEEQSARLGRKNVQVIDRLAKMHAHELLSIQTLQNCCNISDKALHEAKKFHTKCGVREVPLLKWTVAVGRSTGTCTVTANHILFVTKLIPVVGGNQTVLFNVDDVELIMEEKAASIVNPMPTVIHVKQNRRTVYSFRPSMGAARFKSFFDVVKAAASRTLFDVSP